MIRTNKLKYIKVTNNNCLNNTSFYDCEIYASYDNLVKLFGEPFLYEDCKTKHEWIFRGPDGIVTLYDFRFDGSKTNNWHIGSKDHISSIRFEKWVKEKLLTICK